MKTDEMKAWIDRTSYQGLLAKWRFEPGGSPWFQGEVGKYFAKVMAEKRASDPDEHVRASKAIGWQR